MRAVKAHLKEYCCMTQLAQDKIIPEPTTARSTATTPKPTAADGSRLIVFLHALAFVAGFTLVFTLIGSAAGLIGQNLNHYLPAVQRVGAVLLFIFALVTLGVFRWLVDQISARTDLEQNPAAAALVSVLNFFNTLLYTEKRVMAMHQVNRKWGYLSSALLGVSFSAGWTPCVGPILGGIWMLAQSSATVGQGASLHAIYSLGLGIPFLLTAAAFTTSTRALRRLNRHANIVGIISGLFLLMVAALLWNGTLTTLTTRFDFLNQFMLRIGEWTSNVEMDMSAAAPMGDIASLSIASGAPLAFIAGLLSFLSPCVLPLIPAYIGYLSGTAVGNKS